jgi:hypothetical protein
MDSSCNRIFFIILLVYITLVKCLRSTSCIQNHLFSTPSKQWVVSLFTFRGKDTKSWIFEDFFKSFFSGFCDLFETIRELVYIWIYLIVCNCLHAFQYCLIQYVLHIELKIRFTLCLYTYRKAQDALMKKNLWDWATIIHSFMI